MNDPMEKEPKRVCGAMNRQGKPCQKPPLRGKLRCMMHGGKTPSGKHTGKKNGNHRHSLYSAHLTEAEQAQWDNIQLGVVDEELRMLRIYLARCVALDATISKDPNSTTNSASMELTEVRRSSGPEGPISVDVISKRPDVMSRMNWLIGRIGQLE